MTRGAARERRWIILGEDGRHVTVGRQTDPSDTEIARAAEMLRAGGKGGGLAVLEGRYYVSRERVALMMVRELAPTNVTWTTAVEAFQSRRQAKG